jgi:hypothetical protein
MTLELIVHPRVQRKLLLLTEEYKTEVSAWGRSAPGNPFFIENVCLTPGCTVSSASVDTDSEKMMTDYFEVHRKAGIPFDEFGRVFFHTQPGGVIPSEDDWQTLRRTVMHQWNMAQVLESLGQPPLSCWAVMAILSGPRLGASLGHTFRGHVLCNTIPSRSGVPESDDEIEGWLAEYEATHRKEVVTVRPAPNSPIGYLPTRTYIPPTSPQYSKHTSGFGPPSPSLPDDPPVPMSRKARKKLLRQARSAQLIVPPRKEIPHDAKGYVDWDAVRDLLGD